MKPTFLIILTLVLTAATFAQSRVGGRVVEVLDGKTVIVQTYSDDRLTAELQYIEVPETGQPLSQIAKDHLQTLVLNKKVEFRARGFTNNKTIGQLLLNGVDVSQQMIRDGAAWYAVLQKNAQDYNESVIYQNNEARAKSEKLGIWSIADLKPSWEIRAEAEANRRQQEKIVREEQEKAALKAAAEMSSTPKPVKRALSSESQLLTANSESIGKMPANMKMIGGLQVGYDPSAKFGVVATPLLKMNLIDRSDLRRISFQIGYLYYDANVNKGRQDNYFVGIDLESGDADFIRKNELTVSADNQKILIGKAKRFSQDPNYRGKAGLFYEIKRGTIARIVKAGKLKIQIGAFSRDLSDDGIQALLQNLLNASER